MGGVGIGEIPVRWQCVPAQMMDKLAPVRLVVPFLQPTDSTLYFATADDAVFLRVRVRSLEEKLYDIGHIICRCPGLQCSDRNSGADSFSIGLNRSALTLSAISSCASLFTRDPCACCGPVARTTKPDVVTVLSAACTSSLEFAHLILSKPSKGNTYAWRNLEYSSHHLGVGHSPFVNPQRFIASLPRNSTVFFSQLTSLSLEAVEGQWETFSSGDRVNNQEKPSRCFKVVLTSHQILLVVLQTWLLLSTQASLCRLKMTRHHCRSFWRRILTRRIPPYSGDGGHS